MLSRHARRDEARDAARVALAGSPWYTVGAAAGGAWEMTEVAGLAAAVRAKGWGAAELRDLLDTGGAGSTRVGLGWIGSVRVGAGRFFPYRSPCVAARTRVFVRRACHSCCFYFSFQSCSTQYNPILAQCSPNTHTKQDTFRVLKPTASRLVHHLGL